MRILISQRVFFDRHGTPCEYLEESYISFFESFGIDLFPVSNFRKGSLPSYLLSFGPIDGLILSGGNDVDSRLYGKKPLPCTDSFPRRDQTEKEMLNFSMQKKIPLLAICRGMQFLNVSFGGSLIQSIERQLDLLHPPGVDHTLDIVDSAAKEFFLEGRWHVNSYHLQAVTSDSLAPCLKPFALTSDKKIIEGLYHPDLPVAGVQFHPERTKDPVQKLSQKKIVDAFVNRELFWRQR